MGIAAYNRGSEVVSRQIAENLPDHNSVVVASLNALPRGEMTLFCETVIRLLPGGGWALMNREEGGFASSAREYKTLRQLFASWKAFVVGYGCDEHSFFYRVKPTITVEE